MNKMFRKEKVDKVCLEFVIWLLNPSLEGQPPRLEKIAQFLDDGDLCASLLAEKNGAIIRLGSDVQDDLREWLFRLQKVML